MREQIFLNFGNYCNYVSTHFWNLLVLHTFNIKDESMKYDESNEKFNYQTIMNSKNYPRNLLFDFSENIRPYFVSNEKMSIEEQESLINSFQESK